MSSTPANVISLLLLLLLHILFVSSQSNSSSRLIQRKLKLSFLTKSDSSRTRMERDVGYSGYYRLPGQNLRMFYYFFDERSPPNSPIMLWLSGQPGLTCSIALFHETGPLSLNDDLMCEVTEYGWDKVVKIIYIDEPVGTGFSDIPLAYTRNEPNDNINHLYSFLVDFFRENWEYKDSDFFITGQSYAGKYAPMLARKIHEENWINPDNNINLMGVALGGGLTDPSVQFGTVMQFSNDRELIKDEHRTRIEVMNLACIKSATDCASIGGDYACLKAYDECQKLLTQISSDNGDMNIYDITKPDVTDLHYDFSKLKTYLNEPFIKKTLGVAESKVFHLFNSEVHEAMKADYMTEAVPHVVYLLNNDVNVLVYVGRNDLYCNWLGNLGWVKKLKWRGSKEFKKTIGREFLFKGKNSAFVRGNKRLAFFHVYDAGHMVAMDQPELAYHMLKKWIKQELTD